MTGTIGQSSAQALAGGTVSSKHLAGAYVVPEPPSRVRIPRWVAIVASVIILAFTIWFIVVPQFAEAKDALTSLEKIAVPMVLLALVLELASLGAYSVMTRVIVDLPQPGLFTFIRIDLTDLGVNHVVPGGGMTSGALRLRFFNHVGIPPATGFTAATVQITASNLILGAIFGFGIALSISSHAANTSYVVAAGAVLVLLIAAGTGVWMLVRHTAATARWVRVVSRFVPFLNPIAAEAFVRAMAVQVRTLGTDHRRIAIAVTFGALNWLLDASALWVMFAAFGQPLPVGTLLTVYGLGSILAMLPLTPGGLGLVEGLMVPVFVAFGVPAPVALLGVLGWRLLEYWMPIPLSLLAYGSLRLGVFRTRHIKETEASGERVPTA